MVKMLPLGPTASNSTNAAKFDLCNKQLGTRVIGSLIFTSSVKTFVMLRTLQMSFASMHKNVFRLPLSRTLQRLQ